MSEPQIKQGSIAAKVGTAGAAGVALAACAACCAPLAAPSLAWFGLSSLGAATTGWYAQIEIVSIVTLAVFLLYRRHQALKRSQSCQVDGRCGCGGDAKADL